MKQLRWHQVNTWRLSRHCLSPRLRRPNLVEAEVERLGAFLNTRVVLEY